MGRPQIVWMGFARHRGTIGRNLRVQEGARIVTWPESLAPDKYYRPASIRDTILSNSAVSA